MGGAIMGRTPMSWFLITVFYIIYYSCLAGFWALCMFIFYQFIEEQQPRWQQDEGLIGRSPALGVRPGQHDSIIESSVIIFNHDNPNDDENIPGYQQWVDRLDDYLEPYKTNKPPGLSCAPDQPTPEGKSCKAEFPADKEGVKSLELLPSDGGFPSYYFPYSKQEGYQSPLVAVRINEINPGQLIHVECRAWAKNIKYNRRDRVGIVRFELMNHNGDTTEEVNKLN